MIPIFPIFPIFPFFPYFSKNYNPPIISNPATRELFLQKLLCKKPVPSTCQLASLSLRSSFEAAELEPSFYYYKRWVWLIFPMACIIRNKSCDFSKVMSRDGNAKGQWDVMQDEKIIEYCKI
jgi:hypothetical protein